MDTRFESIASHPSNQIFNIVFFPDRVYHAEYLNATRSSRYRYNVTEVRSKASMQAMKGEVFLDGGKLCNFLRIEYRSSRLVEQAREAGRFMGRGVIIWLNLQPEGLPEVSARVRLEYCPWIDAFQGEIWETLETTGGQTHDFKVLQMMGKDSSITSIPEFRPALADTKNLRRLQIAARRTLSAIHQVLVSVMPTRDGIIFISAIYRCRIHRCLRIMLPIRLRKKTTPSIFNETSLSQMLLR